MTYTEYCKDIISKIIKFENERIEKDLKIKDMCLCFADNYLNERELLKGALIALRDTKLECIKDEVLNSQINNLSTFFPGREMLLLDIVKILVFYNIDTQNSINFLFQRLEYYNRLPQNDESKYDFAFEMFVMSLFSKEFELYNCEFDYNIEDFIIPEKIKDASTANLYFNIVRSLHPDNIESIPLNILNVAIIIESIGIIDGDGLEAFYSYFSTDYIQSVAEGMSVAGLDEIGKIILQGLEFLENGDKLEKLQNKIYKCERKISVNNLLDNYLKYQSGDGSMIDKK